MTIPALYAIPLALSLQAVIAFSAMFALDFVWVFYTRAVTARRPAPAGLWAAAITVFNGLLAVLVVASPWALAPAALGAFAGTLVAMRRPHAAP